MENSGSFKEKSFLNGVYFGEFKSKLFHGKGKYTWSNGTIYEGDWVDGKRTGKGRIIWPCGKKYKGGNGPVMGKNRNIYIGNWKNNQRDGRGIVKWASGEVLEGCWSNGLLRSGVYRLANGDVYTGDFKGSIFHEKGESAWSNDEIIYEGDWVNGKMTGKGLAIWPSGTNYERKVSKNYSHGNGTYTWKDGSIYFGNWKNSKIDGKGVMKWANGDVFEGCWSKGLRHGSGVYRFAKGDVCNGNFKSKFLHGKGKYTCSNGTIYKGYWDDGTMTEKIPDLENLVGDCMLLHICNKGESDAGLSCLVTKGKNIQGVMIVERIEQYSEISKLSEMQGKKSSSISTFFKIIKAKLGRNLQLRIRDHGHVLNTHY
ncbi:phosphatidylinositol 4-phosphate 5-kinase 6-like [Vicia villosa]|uniref:phosphatidylinositol 4-phosphate 5-kinase 6-like n=1 Tax=Vicia villosa TaxID=3911 RepID=UPI00273AD970|nr:phosphatidylinositol 4-phosphate 5-kinase 6-like [Vicia villosa]XP_058755815.1 phosphatidylinositol 4-phosphate 5-kinase 6-like [Vicia villosa]